MKSTHYAAIALGIVLIGGSFYGGLQYEAHAMQSQRNARFGAGMNRGTQDGFVMTDDGMMRTGQNIISGSVTSLNGSILSLQLRDGSTKTITIANTTKITKPAEGILSDLKAGTQVSVFGTIGDDQNVTATSIQIRPAMTTQPTP